MTSSSPSPDPAGFARHDNEGERLPLTGLFASEMPARQGVFLTDMPAGRPVPRRPKVKGVPGPSTSADGDYAAGQGTWRDVE